MLIKDLKNTTELLANDNAQSVTVVSAENNTVVVFAKTQEILDEEVKGMKAELPDMQVIGLLVI